MYMTEKKKKVSYCFRYLVIIVSEVVLRFYCNPQWTNYTSPSRDLFVLKVILKTSFPYYLLLFPHLADGRPDTARKYIFPHKTPETPANPAMVKGLTVNIIKVGYLPPLLCKGCIYLRGNKETVL